MTEKKDKKQPAVEATTHTLRIDKLSQPKKHKALIPREIRRDVARVYKTQISKKHFKGVSQLDLFGEVAKWESLGVEYFIKTSDLEKMKYKKPQVYTEAKKNIYLLINYIVKQQAENGGRAKATFSLSSYLKDKGYTDKELKRGSGRLYDLAKQVLESGAYTNFRRMFRSTDGKRGLEILGSFYTLIKEGEIDKKTGEIKGKGVKYKISFNAPYADYIERGLQEGGQFYPIPLKLIADRNVDKNPVLFNFIDYLVYIKGGRNFPKKIINLLKDIGVKEDELKRQPKCFERLKACLAYAHKNYPELLESIEILNESQEKKIPLSSLSILEKYTQQEFRELIQAVGGKDLRECYILFYHGEEKKQITERPTPQANTGRLVDEIMEWVDRCVDFTKTRNITREGTQKFLGDAEKHLGFNKLNDLFGVEATASYPNAFNFLTKILPQEIKSHKNERNDLDKMRKIWGKKDNLLKRF